MRHEDEVRLAEFSPDGQRIATASQDGIVRCWDAFGKAIGAPVKHERTVSSIQFSPDEQRFVTFSLGGTIRFFDASTGEEIAEQKEIDRRVISVQFSPDGRRLVTFSNNGVVQLLDGVVDSCAIVQSIKGVHRESHAASGKEIALRYEGSTRSPDGQRIVTIVQNTHPFLGILCNGAVMGCSERQRNWATDQV